MPQIDTAAYFPIILWSLIIICLGFILFNLYFFLGLVSIMKLSQQWRSFEQRFYWLYWNKEEVVDWFVWTNFAATKLRQYDLEK